MKNFDATSVHKTANIENAAKIIVEDKTHMVVVFAVATVTNTLFQMIEKTKSHNKVIQIY